MPSLGYLLPNREHMMEGRPETAPLLALAERAEGLGLNSIWVGDSLLAPGARHLALLAGDHERQLDFIAGLRRELGW